MLGRASSLAVRPDISIIEQTGHLSEKLLVNHQTHYLTEIYSRWKLLWPDRVKAFKEVDIIRAWEQVTDSDVLSFILSRNIPELQKELRAISQDSAKRSATVLKQAGRQLKRYVTALSEAGLNGNSLTDDLSIFAYEEESPSGVLALTQEYGLYCAAFQIFRSDEILEATPHIIEWFEHQYHESKPRVPSRILVNALSATLGSFGISLASTMFSLNQALEKYENYSSEALDRNIAFEAIHAFARGNDPEYRDMLTSHLESFPKETREGIRNQLPFALQAARSLRAGLRSSLGDEWDSWANNARLREELWADEESFEKIVVEVTETLSNLAGERD